MKKVNRCEIKLIELTKFEQFRGRGVIGAIKGHFRSKFGAFLDIRGWAKLSHHRNFPLTRNQTKQRAFAVRFRSWLENWSKSRQKIYQKRVNNPYRSPIIYGGFEMN